MLQIIPSIFNNIILLVNFVYTGCFVAGKLIYYLITQLANLIINFIKFVMKNYHTFYKEFTNFIEELLICLGWIIDSINMSIEGFIEIYHDIEKFYIRSKSSILNILSGKVEQKYTIWDLMCWLANSFRQGLHLIGDTMFGIIKSIPYIIVLPIKYICDLFTIASNILTLRPITFDKVKRIHQSIWSFIISIIIFTCFIYLLIRHRRKIYKLLKNIFIFVYIQILQIILSFLRSLKRIVSLKKISLLCKSERTTTTTSNEDGNELLCLLCQEERKNVVLLPCKHLCMCNKCSDNLRFFQQTCPLCRTMIISKMKIYI